MSGVTSPPGVAPAPPGASAGARPRLTLTSLSRRRWFRRVVVWGALVLIYQLLAHLAGPLYLPGVWDVLVQVREVLADGAVMGDLGQALIHLCIGFGLAVVTGIAIGVVMGSSTMAEYVIGFFVRAMFVTSLVAVLPVLIILFGFGMTFRVATVYLFSVFFIILSTATGVREVDPQLMTMGWAFGAGRAKRAWAIGLPSSLPFIVSGMRNGLAQAFAGMILAELWVTRGFGLTLTSVAANRDLPRFFALLLIVTVLAAGLTALLKVVERRLMPWGNVSQGGPVR